jgi:DNA invertase Pin-like site-specific DNA recombinase
MRTKKKAHRAEGVIGYLRVSTEEQAHSGLGLAAQEAAIRAECDRRGVPLVALHTDAGVTGKSLARPALSEALAALDRGEGSVLVVSKLDRLTRSVHDASGLMMTAEKGGWGLVALDVAVDTTTPQGAAMAHVLATFAELERKLIGQRTRDALAVRRAEGVQLGRRPTLPAAVVRRIVKARRAGATWSSISRELNEEGVPTAQSAGNVWYPATVRQVVLRAEEIKKSVSRKSGSRGRGNGKETSD